MYTSFLQVSDTLQLGVCRAQRCQTPLCITKCQTPCDTQVLTDQPTPRGASTYWAVLKKRLKEEGADELITNCKQLKLPAADGKKYKTDVADLEQIFRIIQSVPSKKAEPVKRWLAELGSMRVDQMIDPELTFQMAVEDYRRQGYSDRWINERMRSIAYKGAQRCQTPLRPQAQMPADA